MFMLLACLLAPQPQRQIPIMIQVEVPAKVKTQAEIPLTITIKNGMPGEIEFHGFGIVPMDWNGETVNLELPDIYRDGQPTNIYQSRPRAEVPRRITGMARQVIRPGQTLTIRTDARKWNITGGWIPGRYRLTVRVERLTVDAFATLSVRSEPMEFTIE